MLRQFFRKAIREAERGEKRKRRASVQSVSSAASNASTDYSGSSSDCEVEQVIVKKKSAKLAAIFMGKKEVVLDNPLSALIYLFLKPCRKKL